MIDLTELKSETKHAVGFKNNFYNLRICYPDILNNVRYSFYSWKSKVDLMNSNRLCSKTIEMEILTKEENNEMCKKKGIEFMFDTYSSLISFVKKYNDTYREGFTPFFVKIIYKKQTRNKTLLSLDYNFF